MTKKMRLPVKDSQSFVLYSLTVDAYFLVHFCIRDRILNLIRSILQSLVHYS